MTYKRLLPHNCSRCGCNLYLIVADDTDKGRKIISNMKKTKDDKNYVYSKGNYVCRKCFYRRKKR